MEERIQLNIHINIYGGDNQILLNGAQSGLYCCEGSEDGGFAGSACSPHVRTSDDEKRFLVDIAWSAGKKKNDHRIDSEINCYFRTARYKTEKER